MAPETVSDEEMIKAGYEALWKRLEGQSAKTQSYMLKMLIGTMEGAKDENFLRVCNRAADAYLAD